MCRLDVPTLKLNDNYYFVDRQTEAILPPARKMKT